MDEFPRRTFCTLLAASAGAVSGCNSMSQNRSTSASGPAVSKRVATRKELEAAFDDLSPGETIYISGDNAPYRTTQWLDIDVDGVTVVGPGVQTLVKPADGANVGGFRIGHNSHCRGIEIGDVGFHGNPDGQGNGAERLHGIAVRSAENVTLQRNDVQQTYPRKHGDGGSGISVSRECSDVQVFNNAIHGYGDRGIQLAGKRLIVYGNAVRDGIDRAIACDLWYPDGRNNTAQNVSIFGNLLGNSVEGSLVGIARNAPVTSNEGYVSIFGNIGFGTHKSFCHVRGPKELRNVSIQNNVSVQRTDQLQTEHTEKFAGIAVGVDSARNLAIKNNELYDYSGHGIHVNSDVQDISIQQNTISSAGRTGIRLVGGGDGIVAGNLVTETNGSGIRLRNASRVAVRGNQVRRTGAEGIVSFGASSETGNDVAGNYVTANGRKSRSASAIFVGDSGTRVRGNTIRQHDGAAIAEADGAGGNLYEDNWASGDRPWQITSSTSRLRNNTPPTGAIRGASARPMSDVVRVEFDRPYDRRPRLAFGRVGGGVRDVSYETDGNGNYVGANVTVERPGATIDVFVDGA